MRFISMPDFFRPVSYTHLHVQKQRRELVSLVFSFRDRILQDLCHVVEVPRQNADFILTFDLNALGKVARSDLPRTEGQRADGRDENLRKKERQNDTDHKTESSALRMMENSSPVSASTVARLSKI